MFSVARYEFENTSNEDKNDTNNSYLTKVEHKINELKKKKKESKGKNKNKNKNDDKKKEENVASVDELSTSMAIDIDSTDAMNPDISESESQTPKRKVSIESDESPTLPSEDTPNTPSTPHVIEESHSHKRQKIIDNNILKREDRVKNKKEKSLLGLPEWLAKPILISPYIEKNDNNAITNPKFYLSPSVIACLNQMQITHLFPVQTSVLPFLLSTPTSTRMTGDLCVSAPTGSGKTLAYVLPIVETLSKRIIQRLRALIILPTRDLVAQVKETFHSFTQKTNLKVIAITGSISFSNEQSQLIDEKTGDCKVDIVIATPGRLIDHLNGTPGFTLSHLRYLIIDEADRLLNQHYQDWLNQVLNCINSVSNSNSISTSRHLHSNSDPNNNNHNHNNSNNNNHNNNNDHNNNTNDHNHNSDNSHNNLDNNDPNNHDLNLKDDHSNPTSTSPILFNKGLPHFSINEFGLPQHSAQTFRKNNANLVTDTNYDYLSNENRINHCTPVQKLLFSATLTRNPAKIASLQLYNPTYISVSTIVHHREEGEEDLSNEGSLTDSHYVIPPELHESMMVCRDSGQKPLALFHLLFNLRIKNALCFTNSLESAHRLGRLIHIFNQLWEKKKVQEAKENAESEEEKEEDSPFQPVTTAVISSEMPLATRRKILHSSTLPTIIICSDIMARGLDLSNQLSFDYVVNYEIPNRPKTYVHRVGRTARAGKKGQAISIVEAREAKWFKDMMLRIDREEHKKVKKTNFKDRDIRPFYETYNASLKELKEEVYQKKFNKENKKSDKRLSTAQQPLPSHTRDEEDASSSSEEEGSSEEEDHSSSSSSSSESSTSDSSDDDTSEEDSDSASDSANDSDSDSDSSDSD